MTHQSRIHRQRGSTLIMALAALSALIGLGTAVLLMTTNEHRATTDEAGTLALRNIAEAGIEKAFAQMNLNPTWRCTGSPSGFTNTPLTTMVAGTSTTLGTYTVDPIVDMGGDYLQVTAHAYIPSATALIKQQKQVRVIAYKRWGCPFSAAAFGRAGVPLANGETDSYNSGVGSYLSQEPGNKGDIRTDSTDPSSINIKSQGQCNGKVIFGPGTVLSTVTLNRSLINDGDSDETNDIQVAGNTAVMPDIVIPSGATPISSLTGGTNSLTNSVVLTAGTYYCDSINLTGNSLVTTVGRVILYVNGSMSIGGNGIVNNGDTTGGTALPSNLLIYGTSNCTSVSISGNGALTAAVYAPQADITLNGAGTNGEVFGALAGKTVSFNGNGTVLHYDEALQNVKGVITGFRAKTWEEE